MSQIVKGYPWQISTLRSGTKDRCRDWRIDERAAFSGEDELSSRKPNS